MRAPLVSLWKAHPKPKNTTLAAGLQSSAVFLAQCQTELTCLLVGILSFLHLPEPLVEAKVGQMGQLSSSPDVPSHPGDPQRSSSGKTKFDQNGGVVFGGASHPPREA